MHVDTVDTVEKPWFWAFQNIKQIENWSNIKEVMSQYVLAMFSLYMSTLSANNIAYTIHSSIALILCIEHLDMPFNVHTTDKVTVSGFLTI